MLLRRLVYPCRYSDIMARFGGHQVPVLSMITNTVMDYIYEKHHTKLTQWNQAILNPTAIQRYADRIHEKGAPLENCFGFIDGTVRPVSRPRQYQRVLYNGHKRVHSIKFQSTVIPNGLIANLYGPVGKHIFNLLVIFTYLQHTSSTMSHVRSRWVTIWGLAGQAIGHLRGND